MTYDQLASAFKQQKRDHETAMKIALLEQEIKYVKQHNERLTGQNDQLNEQLKISGTTHAKSVSILEQIASKHKNAPPLKQLDYDDSMEGDNESGLASAGWGTDEDYGSYGDDIDAFHDYYGEDY